METEQTSAKSILFLRYRLINFLKTKNYVSVFGIEIETNQFVQPGYCGKGEEKLLLIILIIQ